MVKGGSTILSLKTNLAVATWPKYTHGKRLLILAAGPDVPSTLAQSCSNLQVVEGEVQRALAKRGLNLPNGAYLLYKELVAGFDGCTLVTNNPTLLSFLLVSCPSLGSPGRLRHTKGLTIIRPLAIQEKGGDVEMSSVGENLISMISPQSAMVSGTSWSRMAQQDGGQSRGKVIMSNPKEAGPLLAPFLLDKLHDGPVFQRNIEVIGPSSVLAFAHCCKGLDDGAAIAEIILRVITALSKHASEDSPELTLEYWQQRVGVQHVWNSGGPMITRFLLVVRPGLQHKLIVDALHGTTLPWDIDGAQPLFASYTFCVCVQCRRRRRDFGAYGCTECTSKGHLDGDSNCPRVLERQSRAALNRTAREVTSSQPTAAAEMNQSASSSASNKRTVPESINRPPTAVGKTVSPGSSQASALTSSPGSPAVEKLSVETAGPSVHTGGRAPSGTGGAGRGGRGGRKGGGPSDSEIIPWLCSFCDTPTGWSSMHNRKYCTRHFRIPAPHELRFERCGFCDHDHPFTKCPILFGAGTSYHMPNCYLDMAVMMGYKVIQTGEVRSIRVQDFLPSLGSLPVASPSGSSHSSLSSLSVASVEGELSVASTSPEIQQVMDVLLKQNQFVATQFRELTETVQNLAEGQSDLHQKLVEQAQLATAVAGSVNNLRQEVDEANQKNKRDLDEAMKQCRAAVEALGGRFGSAGKGVEERPRGGSSK